jgi:hypothetical protein
MKEIAFDSRVQRHQYDAIRQLLTKMGESLPDFTLPPSHFSQRKPLHLEKKHV